MKISMKNISGLTSLVLVLISPSLSHALDLNKTMCQKDKDTFEFIQQTESRNGGFADEGENQNSIIVVWNGTEIPSSIETLSASAFPPTSINTISLNSPVNNMVGLKVEEGDFKIHGEVTLSNGSRVPLICSIK